MSFECGEYKELHTVMLTIKGCYNPAFIFDIPWLTTFPSDIIENHIQQNSKHSRADQHPRSHCTLHFLWAQLVFGFSPKISSHHFSSDVSFDTYYIERQTKDILFHIFFLHPSTSWLDSKKLFWCILLRLKGMLLRLQWGTVVDNPLLENPLCRNSWFLGLILNWSIFDELGYPALRVLMLWVSGSPIYWPKVSVFIVCWVRNLTNRTFKKKYQ